MMECIPSTPPIHSEWQIIVLGIVVVFVSHRLPLQDGLLRFWWLSRMTPMKMVAAAATISSALASGTFSFTCFTATLRLVPYQALICPQVHFGPGGPLFGPVFDTALGSRGGHFTQAQSASLHLNSGIGFLPSARRVSFCCRLS